MINYLIGELEQIAEEIDDLQTRNSYAMAMFNLYVNTPEGKFDLQMEEKLYGYAFAHIVELETVEAMAGVAVEMMIEFGKRGAWEPIARCYGRAKALAIPDAYAGSERVIELAAAAEYEMMLLASNAGNVPMARNMFDNLAQLAAEHPENYGVIVRLAMAGKNMILDYGEMGDAVNTEEVYRTFLPLAMPFSEDTDIADQIVGAAHSFCVDLINAGNMTRVRQIYEEVKDLKPAEDAAKRLEWLKTVI